MSYVWRKIILFVVTLWASVTLNFLLPRMMPGLAGGCLPSRSCPRGVSRSRTPSGRRSRAQLGSPARQPAGAVRPLPRGTSRGLDFGSSYTFPNQSVSQTITSALPWTLVLVGVTTIVAFVIGTLLGVYAGWRRGSKGDAGVTVGATLFAAFPPFWLGLLLLFVFAFKFNALPIKGGYSPGLTPQSEPELSQQRRDPQHPAGVHPGDHVSLRLGLRDAQQHDQHPR